MPTVLRKQANQTFSMHVPTHFSPFLLSKQPNLNMLAVDDLAQVYLFDAEGNKEEVTRLVWAKKNTCHNLWAIPFSNWLDRLTSSSFLQSWWAENVAKTWHVGKQNGRKWQVASGFMTKYEIDLLGFHCFSSFSCRYLYYVMYTGKKPMLIKRNLCPLN